MLRIMSASHALVSESGVVLCLDGSLTLTSAALDDFYVQRNETIVSQHSPLKLIHLICFSVAY